jgi:opacity protein-like surface antigen
MKPAQFVQFAIIAASLGGIALRGQTPSEPTMDFTIHAGVATGHSLWGVPLQPLRVDSTHYDTVRLARSVGNGITVGLSLTYYPNAHVGYYGDISYVGLSMDDACSGVHVTTAAHDTLCQSVSGSSLSLGAITFSGGVVLRVLQMGGVSPYLRAGAGLALIPRSTLDMSGVPGNTSPSEAIVIDKKGSTLSPMLSLGAGLRAVVSPGSALRLEASDFITPMRRLQGPVNALGQGPSDTHYYHHLVLRIGFDVVLEQKRGRRY